MYTTSGWLESATFDFATADVSYTKLDWQPHEQPGSTGVHPIKFQIATSNSSTLESWQYLGPDGNPDTYYNLTNQDINSIHNGQRYLRYKLYLQTGDDAYTPVVSEVNIFYVKSCSLPGQVYFDTIPQATNNMIDVSADGYASKNITGVTIDSNITTTTFL